MTLCAFSFLSQTMNLLNVNSPMSTDQSLAGNRLLKFEIISNRNSNNYYYYFDQKRYFNPNVIQCNAKPVCFSVAPTFENVTKSLSQTAARMFNVNYVNIKMFIKIRLTYLFFKWNEMKWQTVFIIVEMIDVCRWHWIVCIKFHWNAH